MLGDNTLSLSGDFTYPGTIAVGAGATLNAVSSGALGGADLTVDGSLVFSASGSQVFSGDISGSGSMVTSGAANVVLNGTDTLGGNVTVNGGSQLEISDALSLGGTLTGNVAVDSGATLTFANPAGETYSGDITGAGSVIASGSVPLTLTGDNSGFNGSIEVTAGATLEAATPDALGGSSFGNVSVEKGGTLTVPVGGPGDWNSSDISTLLQGATFVAGSFLGIDTTDGSFSYGGLIGGKSNDGPDLLVLGDNVLTLDENNTGFTGTIEVTAGATLECAVA